MLHKDRRLVKVALMVAMAGFIGTVTPQAQSTSPTIQDISWSVSAFRLASSGTPAPKLKMVLTKALRLRIKLVGPDGRRVRTLLPDTAWEVGPHSVAWDGKDDAGRAVPAEAYVPLIETESGGRWTPEFNPNAENHGLKAEIVPLQWDAVTGKLALYAKFASRIKVWVVRGDDGWIVSTLKDMEPVPSGLLSFSWTGEGPVSQGASHSAGFHYAGYELPQCALIVEGGSSSDYLKARERFPIEPASVPVQYEDSWATYRYEYLNQKVLRFAAALSGATLSVIPEPLFVVSFREDNPEARVFFQDGSWAIASLQKSDADPTRYVAHFDKAKFSGRHPSTVIVYTSRDQYGYWNLGQ